MAKNFVRSFKEVKKDIPKIAGKAFIRGGAAMGTAYVSNTLIDKIPGASDLDWLPKAKGPLLFLAGFAGECFLTNPYAQAAAQGMSTYGFMETVAENVVTEIPGMDKSDFGLQGLGKAKIDWAKQLEDASKDEQHNTQQIQGLEEGAENNMSGLYEPKDSLLGKLEEDDEEGEEEEEEMEEGGKVVPFNIM